MLIVGPPARKAVSTGSDFGAGPTDGSREDAEEGARLGMLAEDSTEHDRSLRGEPVAIRKCSVCLLS